MLDTIFTQGWKLNVLLYGIIFLLADYAIYKIIFAALVGAPHSYHYEDQKRWYRKASFLGAVIFAPLYEEIMFTYLAYSSFLSYAQEGQEGIVILFVALFFAALHFPGDWRQLGHRLDGPRIYLLIKFQVSRFFYSLAAYFIYHLTGYLWVTILLHYLYNAVVSFYNFDLEDNAHAYKQEGGNGMLSLIILLKLSFAISGIYFFYQQFPQLGGYLIPLAAFAVKDLISLPMFKKSFLTRLDD